MDDSKVFMFPDNNSKGNSSTSDLATLEAEQAESILKSIDTNYAKDKARDEEIASLKDKVSGVESKLDKILDIVSNTNKLN